MYRLSASFLLLHPPLHRQIHRSRRPQARRGAFARLECRPHSIAARLTRRDAGHANRRGVRARAASPHWRTSARRPRGSSAPAGARRGARAKTNKLLLLVIKTNKLLLLVFMKVLIINALVNCRARRACTVY